MKRTLLTLAALFTFAFTAHAQPPSLLNYQGVLKDTAGKVIPDATYQLTFGLYDIATGGTTLWTEVHPAVATAQGIFNVVLGGITLLNLPFDQQYYLGIAVNADPEMAPRNQLTSAPYAMNTKYATFTPQFLTVDGVASPGIAFKTGNGNLSVTVSTSVKCNITVYAQAEPAPDTGGGWYSTELMENGSLLVYKKSTGHGAEKNTHIHMHARTLLPTDGTITYECRRKTNTDNNHNIQDNTLIIQAVPVE